MAKQKLLKNQKVCGTCLYWSGMRTIELYTLSVFDTNDKGFCTCTKSPFWRIQMNGLQTCQKYELWGPINN